MTVTSLDQCTFYHTTDVGSYGTVQGDWDLRGREREYLGGVDFTGKSVLDVGTASGFLTFAVEEMGAARVVSFDADHGRRINLLPMVRDSSIQNVEAAALHTEAGHQKIKASYWLTHREKKSRARAYYGDVYVLPDELGQFDIVIVAQILVHLRDPVAALVAAASRAEETLIVAEGMLLDTQEPIAKLLQTRPTSSASIWWHLSVPLYREILDQLGFEVVHQHTAGYRCVSADQDIPITTLVAKRVAPSVPNPFTITR